MGSDGKGAHFALSSYRLSPTRGDTLSFLILIGVAHYGCARAGYLRALWHWFIGYRNDSPADGEAMNVLAVYPISFPKRIYDSGQEKRNFGFAEAWPVAIEE